MVSCNLVSKDRNSSPYFTYHSVCFPSSFTLYYCESVEGCFRCLGEALSILNHHYRYEPIVCSQCCLSTITPVCSKIPAGFDACFSALLWQHGPHAFSFRVQPRLPKRATRLIPIPWKFLTFSRHIHLEIVRRGSRHVIQNYPALYPFFRINLPVSSLATILNFFKTAYIPTLSIYT